MSVDNSIFFSVIIPSYNRAPFLPITIESVQKQTFSQFEVLVIDDGSKDNSGEIVQKISAVDHRIHYFYKENGERGAARNYGIKKARGKYLVFFDSDDEMLPFYLETLYSFIQKEKEPPMIAGKYEFARNGSISPNPFLKHEPQGYKTIDWLLSGNHLACNFAIKNDPNNLKLFPEDRSLSIMEDWLFLLLNLRNNSLFLIDQVLLRMNDHESRSMRENDLLVIERRKKATEWIISKNILSETETQNIQIGTDYFCAVHYYILSLKKEGLRHCKAYIKQKGWDKSIFFLYIKSLIGIKTIHTLINKK